MFRLVIFSCLFLATFANSNNRPKPSDGRIVGGKYTEITEVPHQVSLQDNEEHFCGGSIIGPKHILTAAHCVENKVPELLSVRAGSTFYGSGGQKVDVKEVIVHPDFNKTTKNYDAAILVLKKSLVSDEGVQIATLANVEPKEGEMVLVSGWGSVGEGKAGSPFLQSVSVPVFSKWLCQERYKYTTKITDQMFCAGYLRGGKDACHGDSGGPAMVNGKLAGIVSWGFRCAIMLSPGIYTNVASILPWIAAVTQE